MNEFENTNLPFLEKDCIETFGEEQGKKVFDKTIEIYRELTGKADYRNNQAIRYHMTVKLFPAMSYYKALQAFGIDDAIEKVRIETQKAALINKQNNAKFARMPFVFTMYRMGVKKHMAKNFPPDCIMTSAQRTAAPNFAKYIAKMIISPFPDLCRRYALKEWERSAKAQSAAISILSKDRGRTMRTKRFVCFFIKHRKTVDRIK